MIQRYDLIIVGGSFAGLACARTAALKGLERSPSSTARTNPARALRTHRHRGQGSERRFRPASRPHAQGARRAPVCTERPLRRFLCPRYFFQATDTPSVIAGMAAEAERAGATLLYGKKFEGAVEHGAAWR